MSAPAAEMEKEAAQTSLHAMRASQLLPNDVAAKIQMGFDSFASFELLRRGAKMMSQCELVPTIYRAQIVKTDWQGNVTVTNNDNAVANCAVAINMAVRMHADPLMVMQNLNVIEGRPCWSSQWIIAQINNCGRFSPLRFKIERLSRKSVKYSKKEWKDKKAHWIEAVADIDDVRCIAWVIEKGTNERLESPPMSIETAVKEGWFARNGSKWQTIPELMLRYRAAAFFGRLYAPELLMGLQSVEEIEDTFDATRGPGGTFEVDIDALRTDKPEPHPDPEAEGEGTTQEAAAASDAPETAAAPETAPAASFENETKQDTGDQPQQQEVFPGPSKSEMLRELAKAKTVGEVALVLDLLRTVENETVRSVIRDAADKRITELENKPAPKGRRAVLT